MPIELFSSGSSHKKVIITVFSCGAIISISFTERLLDWPDASLTNDLTNHSPGSEIGSSVVQNPSIDTDRSNDSITVIKLLSKTSIVTILVVGDSSVTKPDRVMFSPSQDLE